MKCELWKRALAAILGAALVCLALPAAAGAQTMTTLLRSGDNGSKRNLVIIGDGFQAGNDQNVFDTYVDRVVLNGTLTEGPLGEDLNAFNVYRINTVSVDSGVTQVDASGVVTTARNTALDYRFSGVWNRCWMEMGPSTNNNLTNILNNLVPQYDLVFVVLNEPRFGGCRSGAQLAVTLAGDWSLGAHEMGHLVGELGDEYVTTPATTYTGAEPGAPNLTTVISRDLLKWREFVDPATPLPTIFDPATMDPAETVGAFAGGTLGTSSFDAGLWRPTFNSRMSTNRPPFGPVDYNQMKVVLDRFHDFDYLKSYAGDFNGDGRDDVVIQNANSLALYVAEGTVDHTDLKAAWTRTLPLPGWGSFASNDQLHVADFDGDGRDDLYVVNTVDFVWPDLTMLRSTGSGFEVARHYERTLPGWDEIRANDQFFVADFDGDGRQDLYVFNAVDWAVGYLGMLRSTGDDLTMVRRYDDQLPWWDHIRPGDRLHVANFDGRGGDDLYVLNLSDWRFGYLLSLRSTGWDLRPVVRYEDELPGWDSMRRGDQLFVADFDGDEDDDLYVFNGTDWVMGYLAKLRSSRGVLSFGNRWDGSVPGWDELRPGDRFFVADIDGDRQEDLYVYNALDWDTEYLGALLSQGDNALVGSWQKDQIDGWNLGAGDLFVVGNFNGGQGWQDLFVRNADWFGLLRSRARPVSLDAIYPWWIHDHPYHVNGWW